jgi:hypothetical protein
LPYSDAILRAVHALFVAGIVVFAYRTARNARMPTWSVVWRGFLWCAAIALFAAISMGQATCIEQDDPFHGGCSEYADDSFNPTTDERVGRFIYFLIVLYVPVMIGAAGERKEPPAP